MGMAVRSRRSEREEGRERKEREEERPPSPFISLISEIRVWVSILPEIKGSLFHSDRLRRVTASHFLEEHFLFFWTRLHLSVCLFLLCWLRRLLSCPFRWNIAPTSDGSFDSSLLCNTSAGKLHLCKCHTEWKDPAGRKPQALLGHASSLAPGSLRLDEVPKAFWWG